MNDKEFEKAKKRVTALFKKWTKDLGLKWYKVGIIYKMGDAPSRGDDYIAPMMVQSRWMYRTATITVWIEDIPKDDDDLERMIVHELCHILVEPMRDDEVTDNEEMVVESLARAFLWAEQGARERTLNESYQKGWDFVRKESKRGKL